MTSEVTRNQETDQLLTPKNSVLVIIDYQPVQVASIGSMDRDLLTLNIVRVARLGKAYGLPIVLSTVNVATGKNAPTIKPLADELKGIKSYDRTTINAWEDTEFKQAIIATGRKKLIMTALWTEACLTFPTLDAMHEGFEVYPVGDAVGGTSKVAHKLALRRIEQAGAHLIGWAQLACELQRDWAHSATEKPFFDILFESGNSAPGGESIHQREDRYKREHPDQKF